MTEYTNNRDDHRTPLRRHRSAVSSATALGTPLTDSGFASQSAEERTQDPPHAIQTAAHLPGLHSFGNCAIAPILRVPAEQLDRSIHISGDSLFRRKTARVLVIEDDLRAAVELSEIVTSMGHEVVGSAPTEKDALDLAKRKQPDLILSDIQLAEGGSGIATVGRILSEHSPTPVVFITGFPERLLTSAGREPENLIAKPYQPEQVRKAISLALQSI